MDFFSDDPFEEILREFFRGSQSPAHRRVRWKDERGISIINTEDYVYLLFELPGYDEEDIELKVTGNFIEIKAKKDDVGDVQDYLKEKLSRGIFIKKTLPSFVIPKKPKYTLKNGVLEVIFKMK